MTPHRRSPCLVLLIAVLACSGVAASRPAARASAVPPNRAASAGSDVSTSPIPASAIIEPEELARILQSRDAEKPLILQIGFRFLFHEAHIPGSEYVGPASKDDGIKLLRQRVASLARGKFIVLYCGCCPWIKCPNVKPAYEALHSMGFTHVRVLRIGQNFGADWVSKGYPTAKGD